MKEKSEEAGLNLNMIKILFLIIWFIYILVFMILEMYTLPAGVNNLNINISDKWAKLAIYLLLTIQTLLCICGIIFNLIKMKNKTEKIKITIIFLVLMGILGIVLISI